MRNEDSGSLISHAKLLGLCALAWPLACGEVSREPLASLSLPVVWSTEWSAPSRAVVRGSFASQASPTWEVKDCASPLWTPLRAEGDPRGLRWVHDVVCGVRAIEPQGRAPDDVVIHRSPRSLLQDALGVSDVVRAMLSDGDLGTGIQTTAITATFRPKQQLRGLYVAVHEPAAPKVQGKTLYYSATPQAPFEITVRGTRDGKQAVHKFDSQVHFPSRRRYFPVSLDEVSELKFSAPSVVDLRELSLFETEEKPLISPWVLSVNANPSAQVVSEEGHGVINDRYHAKFLTKAFARIDWYPPIEFVRGDDPNIVDWALSSYPKPIIVLSGSNAWEYASVTQRDPSGADRWMWNPLLQPAQGGMGHLASFVREQRAPLLGLCGGGQILVLLAECDPKQSDRCYKTWLKRTTGEPIVGFWQSSHVIRSWPGDSQSRVVVQYDPASPLWSVAGSTGRRLSRGLPESHVDALALEPLRQHWDVSALSSHCVGTRCVQIPEAFALPASPYSVVGTQFHPEGPAFARTELPEDEALDSSRFLTAVLEKFALELFRER